MCETNLYGRIFTLDKWIYYLFQFNELCGFHHSAKNDRKTIEYFLFVVQIIFMCIFTVNGILYVLAIANFLDTLGILNFAFFYVALLISHWIILIESHLKKFAQDRFWQIHGHLNDVSNDFGQRNSMKRKYLFKYALHICMFIVMLFLSSRDKHTTASAVMTYYVLLFVCNNRLYYFLLYLELIKFELEQIKNALVKNQRTDCHDEYLRLLKLVQNDYQRVYELTSCMNMFFGWSQFTTIIISFYTLVTYFNFIYQQIEGKLNGHGNFVFNLNRY